MNDMGERETEWERADEMPGVQCDYDDWEAGDGAPKPSDPRDDIDYGNLCQLMRKGYRCSDKVLGRLVDKMRAVHRINRDAPVGNTCLCPTCGKSFVKRTYHHVFCGTRGHGKKLGRGRLCKDQFWNFTDSGRRSRAAWYR